MSKNILISGGTGLVGGAISETLKNKGFKIAYLSRSKGLHDGNQKFKWDIKNNYLDLESLEWADSIIHLAGAGVADKRWSISRKKEILDSRVNSSKLLYNSIKKGDFKIKKIISASAIGYYGFGGKDKIFKEDDPPANDFLANVTQKWEKATEEFSQLNILNSRIRIGVVLSSKGGAFQKIAQPIKLGAGAPIGSGKQIMSWIHMNDLAGVFLHLLENEKEGIFNGVAPNPVTNKELTKTIARKLNRPLILPNVPSFVLKLALGEMADIVLKGSFVSSAKIEESGYHFQYPELDKAVDNILNRSI